MIEFFTLDNGPTDLPIRLTPRDVTVPEGDLAAMHASRQRAVIHQVRKAMLAERLGFHYYFLTEHHFQPEGAEFSPNPLIIGAAIATRTSRIRIGQLANILPWHHPVRLAEQAAMVDILSGGRLEFGIGRGVQPRETDIFAQVYGSDSANEQRSRAYFQECLDIILKAWTEPSFAYHGEFYSIPPRWTPHHHPMTIEYFSTADRGRSLQDVLELGEPTGVPGGVRSHATVLKELSVFPQPLQQPHPQIWQPVVMNMASLRRAARAGTNVIFLTIDPPRVAEEVATYHAEAAQHDFPDYLHRGAFSYGWDAAKKRGVVHGMEIHIADHGIGSPEKFELAGRHLWTYLRGFNPTAVDGPNRGGAPDLRPRLCGSVEQLIEGILRIKEVGQYADFPCCVMFGGPGFTWEEEQEQMHAFADEIMPVLRRECGGSPELPTVGLAW